MIRSMTLHNGSHRLTQFFDFLNWIVQGGLWELTLWLAKEIYRMIKEDWWSPNDYVLNAEPGIYRVVGTAVEHDIAMPIIPRKSKVLGTALERDTATSIRAVKSPQ